MAPMTRTTDKKARLTLPKDFAQQLVIVDRVSDNEIRIKKAQAIPLNEIWLWNNEKARDLVAEGLRQAEAHEFVDGPDLAADAKGLAQD